MVKGFYEGIISGKFHISTFLVLRLELIGVIATTSDGFVDGLTFFTLPPKNVWQTDPISHIFNELDLIVLTYHAACIVLIVVIVILAGYPRKDWTRGKIWFSTTCGIIRLIPQQNINQDIEKYE